MGILEFELRESTDCCVSCFEVIWLLVMCFLSRLFPFGLLFVANDVLNELLNERLKFDLIFPLAVALVAEGTRFLCLSSVGF